MIGSSSAQASAELRKTSFDHIRGWETDDHRSALRSFLRVCENAPELLRRKPLRLAPKRIDDLCLKAHEALAAGKAAPKRFFERQFTPFRFAEEGFLTGYFEPELVASRTRTPDFATPLLKAPKGLVTVTKANRPPHWPHGLSHGRKTAKGLVALPDRGAIMDGALAAEHLELVYLADPIDAFFVHVQGSARLKLTDGSVMRVGYAGKAGYPYTSIARVLVKRGEGTPEQLTALGLRQWLEAHPQQRDALFRENRSYIFFKEMKLKDPAAGPVGAAGLSLTAGRSLAVDPTHIPYGVPVFVDAETAGLSGKTLSFPRLVIADDTGSAIKGAARGDLFTGSGDLAGNLAGELRQRANMTVLLPNPSSSEGGEG